MSDQKFKKGDKVTRVNGKNIQGIVEDVREEIIGVASSNKKAGFMIKVAWDNGTVSYFSPESLATV